MGMLLAFAPFIAFAVVERLASPTEGLVAGALVATCLLLRDLIRGRTAKVLEVGTAILFAGLNLYALLTRPAWSVVGIRLVVDAGLLLIVLASMAMRRPFTLQYAREQVDAETVAEPEFLRVNYILSWAWVAAMVLMLIADILMIYFPALPLWSGVVAIYLARNAAVYFTKWYSNRWIEKARAIGLKA